MVVEDPRNCADADFRRSGDIVDGRWQKKSMANGRASINLGDNSVESRKKSGQIVEGKEKSKRL
jgi:hypothetical protein